MNKFIKCPECGKPTEYSTTNEYRPFCSNRCKLIDLGEWIEGKYGIESEETDYRLESIQEELSTKH